MKNVNLFICLFILPFTLLGQNQSIDSLKNKLKTLPQDSVYVNILNTIATSFIQTNHFDSAIRYGKPAVELADKLPYLNGAVIAYYNLALYNFHIQEYKPGKALLIKSLTAALQVNDKRNVATIYQVLANLYHLQGNFKLEADSKKKFALYNDSATSEENTKQAAATAAINELKEKEKTELTAKETKLTTESEAQKQRIFYISLVVLIVLSILIIWLLVSRSKAKAKRQATFLDEYVEPEQINSFENHIEQKDKKKDTPAFLQKIAAREALLAEASIYARQPEIVIPVPFGTAVTQEIVDENTALEKPSLEQNANLIEANTHAEKPQIKEIEPKPIENEETIEEADGAMNPVDTETLQIEVIGGNYSAILFSDQLLNFIVKLIDDKVRLVWETITEQNIKSFELEKSVDKTQFVTIETTAANGVDGHSYETFDFKPLPGENFYRLKIIDTENNFMYSSVKLIDILPATTLSLVCYPTHAKDVIMVTAAGGKLPVMVSIYDTAGKKQFFIEVPPTTTPIYISSLANGTYSLQMKCQGKTVLQKLIKNS